MLLHAKLNSTFNGIPSCPITLPPIRLTQIHGRYQKPNMAYTRYSTIVSYILGPFDLF